MSADTPRIDGDYKLTLLDPKLEATQKLLEHHGQSDDSPVLVENEVVDVLEAGACLIKLPGGTVYLALIQSGSITGPATLTQVPIKDALATVREISSEKKRIRDQIEQERILAAQKIQKEADARLLAQAIEKSKSYELPATVPASEVEAVDTHHNKASYSVPIMDAGFSGTIGASRPAEAAAECENKNLMLGMKVLQFVMVMTSLILGTFLLVQPYFWEITTARMVLSCLLGALNLFAAYIHFVGKFEYVKR